MKPKGGAFAPRRRPQPGESRRTLKRFASSVIVNSFSGKSVKLRAAAALRGPTGLGSDAVRDISAGAPTVLADVFALYIKTKNFHWHMSGSDFRDCHLLLDEHGDELFAMTDPLAEWVRKVGGDTLRSIGDISRKQQIADMLAELRDDNGSLVASMRSLHDVCDEYGDGATASLIENWIDETEKRVWFPFEILRDTNGQ